MAFFACFYSLIFYIRSRRIVTPIILFVKRAFLHLSEDFSLHYTIIPDLIWGNNKRKRRPCEATSVAESRIAQIKPDPPVEI